jgi:hypothetical protein
MTHRRPLGLRSSHCRTPQGSIKVGVNDDTGGAVGEWKRAGPLLKTELHDDEHREHPAIQISPPQVRQAPCCHHAVEHA